MKRTLILCLVLIMGRNAGECATTFFPPLQPANTISQMGRGITSLADPFASTPDLNYPEISRIEQTLFGRAFPTQNITIRLSRIEKSLFTTTYPSSTNTQRIDNIISNFNQMNKYPNISRNELSRLESRVFNQAFPQSNAQNRIERLEQQVFGAVQSGELDSRYEALKIAAKTYNPNAIYAPNNIIPSNRGWKGVVSGLGNSLLGGNMMGGTMLGGTMTGFTPPINPYNTYDNVYTNGNNRYNNYNSYANPYSPGYGMYKGYRSNHGYYDGFQDYSSGAGVTILD